MVWPVILEHPVLYHMIAALTCLHTSHLQPQLRSEGFRNLHSSSKLLSKVGNEVNRRSYVDLAAHVVLVHAHNCNHESPFLAIAHIETAGVLVKKILSSLPDLAPAYGSE
jgi:hypothetical protein